MIVYEGRLTPEDKDAARYHYVPFDVGAGAEAVSVSVGFEPPGAVVDLGLFDRHGFRGYSGGARDHFVISRDDATPGYIPGELPAGEWHLLLGPYAIPSEGVAVRVSVSTGPERPDPLPEPPAPPARPPRRELPARPGRRWVACDLHAHTVHSDGALTPHELAARARERGLDVVAVTDHNTISHHRHIGAAGRAYELELIAGQEVTTDAGHMNCFGAIGWIDFRERPERWVRWASERGGLASVNHPVGRDAWRYGPSRAPLVELWHSSWDRVSDEPVKHWRDSGAIPIGGSDFHRAGEGIELGEPTTWLEVGDGEGPLDALATGRVTISFHPRGPVVVPHDNGVEVIDGDGATLVDGAGRPHRIRRDRGRVRTTGPHRLVDDSGLTLALAPHGPGHRTAPLTSPAAAGA